jgi:hypothetical protein
MYYCRVKCKKAQPDFAQFSSTAFNIFRAYEKYSDKNEVAAGNENPIVNMLMLEIKVGVNNSIIYKNERETISNFRFFSSGGKTKSLSPARKTFDANCEPLKVNCIYWSTSVRN